MGVPRPFRTALRLLADLSDEDLRRLTETLASAQPFEAVGHLTDLVREKLPDADEPGVEALMPSLISLCGQTRAHDADQLAESVSKSPDLDLPDDIRPRLAERLKALLTLDSLTTTASAIELLVQNPRNYGSARVLTDIRPIFGRDITEPPKGSVIVELLQLETWSPDGDRDMVYVAMDESDLSELKNVVDRALDKTTTLRGVLDTQGVKLFQLDEKDR